MTSDAAAFLDLAARESVRAELITGTPAEISLAQAIFESGWGRHMAGNNPFGITIHQRKGLPVRYARYPTLSAAFEDHALLLQRGPYRPAWLAYKITGDFERWLSMVCQIYAQDEHYFEKILNQIMAPECYLALSRAREHLVSAG